MSKVQRPYSDIHSRVKGFSEWEIEQAIAALRQILADGGTVDGRRTFDWQSVQQFCMENFVRETRQKPEPTEQEAQSPPYAARPAEKVLTDAIPPIPLSEFQQKVHARVARILAGAAAVESRDAAGFARHEAFCRRYPDINYFKESNRYE